ncbi:MAG: hypothetical protein Q8K63_10360, partial [Acidimicrobiales bacterium]|nr:hypothetical protein [Acidimicrobiales bacterium]
DAAFRGGVNVAVGDLDNDGLLEVIAGAGPGGGPHVRVFSESGEALASFFVYDEGFDGGVNLGVADVDADGDKELLTAPASGGGPHVQIIDFSEEGPELVDEFFAFENDFLGGLSVAGIYVDDSDNEGIVVGAGRGGGPHVKTYKADLNQVGSWYAYGASYTGGVDVASWYENGDNVQEVVTASLGGPGHVRSFTAAGAPTGGANFYASNGSELGANIASVVDANPFVIAQANKSSGATHMRRHNAAGAIAVFDFTPYPGFGGGVNVATGYGIFDSDPSTPATTTSTSTTSTTTTTTSTTSTTLAT